ncbi:MAG: FAD-dependent oxidoreductase [Parcubacteria group bacterium]
MYELAIIGGGPAGVSAGVYAARKKLKTILITETFGGQSVESVGIENWIGTKNVSGADFAKMLEEHLRAVSDSLDIKTAERVTTITKVSEGFEIKTDKGSYLSKTVLVATGSTRKKLEVPGAKEFENKGITYCASCDGPLFSGQDVIVIGGGNAAFETSAQLLAYTKSVTLLNRGQNFKADPITVDKVLSHPNMTAIKNVDIKEIKGSKFVESLVYTDSTTGEDHELKVGGIFVEIGLIPTTDFVKELVPLNKIGQIPVDPKTQRTSVEGLWAAGDSTDGLYHQNNIASGDAVKALEDIYLHLKAR